MYKEFFIALATKKVQVQLQKAPSSKPIWFDVMQDGAYNLEFIIPLADAVVSVINHMAAWRIKPEPITLYRVELEGTHDKRTMDTEFGVDISSDWHTSEDKARTQLKRRGYCTTNAKVFTKEVLPE